MSIELTPQGVLWGYLHGIFPMADEGGQVGYYSADPRAIIDPTVFHVPRALRQVYRQERFELDVNRNFATGNFKPGARHGRRPLTEPESRAIAAAVW